VNWANASFQQAECYLKTAGLPLEDHHDWEDPTIALIVVLVEAAKPCNIRGDDPGAIAIVKTKSCLGPTHKIGSVRCRSVFLEYKIGRNEGKQQANKNDISPVDDFVIILFSFYKATIF
jgi:hypothetical protein